MKKVWLAALLCLMLLPLAGCQKEEKKTETAAQMPNPFTEVKTMEEAGKIVGFSVTLPEEMPAGTMETTLRASKDGLLEVIYRGGDEEIRVRKAKSEEDISGDYNQYETEKTAEQDGVSVTLKGKSGLVYNAVWQADGFSYAVTSQKGLEEEAALTLAGAVK